MELMDGTLASLAQSLPRGSYRALADHALHQMLQALAYLNRKGYVHRDVKPENIFYKLPSRPPSPGESTESALSRYHFRLGDFGLCAKKSEISILWPHGSVQFMAPELLGGQPQHRQSHKSDVWALYVTILWTLNVKGLRRKMLRRALFGAELAGEAYDEKNGLEDLQKMAEVDPRDRATAGEMLEWLDW
jgi:serine/threonine protein kinase